MESRRYWENGADKQRFRIESFHGDDDENDDDSVDDDNDNGDASW